MTFTQYYFLISFLCLLIPTTPQKVPKDFLEEKLEENTFESIDHIDHQSRVLASTALKCKTNKQCSARVSLENLALSIQPITFELETQTLLYVLVDFDIKDQDIEVYLDSSSSSSLIYYHLVLESIYNVQKNVGVLSGNSWRVLITKDEMESYSRLMLEVENDSAQTTIVKFGVQADSLEGENSSPSIPKIASSVAGTALLIALILGCCYWTRRRRLLKAARAYAVGRNARAQHVNQNNRAQQPNSRAEVANPRPQSNARVRREASIRNAPAVPPRVNKKKKKVTDLLTVENLNERFSAENFEKFQSSFPQTTNKFTSCSICLEDLKEGVLCRQLYCEHIFHSECVKLWLENQLAKSKGQACCPNCNKSVMRPFKKRVKKNQI